MCLENIIKQRRIRESRDVLGEARNGYLSSRCKEVKRLNENVDSLITRKTASVARHVQHFFKNLLFGLLFKLEIKC